MTIARRLIAAAMLPAAGATVVAGVLALSAEAASAAPNFGVDTPTVPDFASKIKAVKQNLPSPADLPQAAKLPNAAKKSQLTKQAPAPKKAKHDQRHAAPGRDVVSSGNYGIANGLQVYAPVTVQADVCGNSISLGGSAAGASCDNDKPRPHHHKPKPHSSYPEPPHHTSYPEPPPPPPSEPELPITGSPLMALAGLGGMMTAGGAAMRMAGTRIGPGYSGRHRHS